MNSVNSFKIKTSVVALVLGFLLFFQGCAVYPGYGYGGYGGYYGSGYGYHSHGYGGGGHGGWGGHHR